MSTTDNPMARRQAGWFALIETAGFLVEKVLTSLGVSAKNERTVTETVWNESILANPINAQWKDALEDVMQWFTLFKNKNFAVPIGTITREGKTEEMNNMHENWSWEGIAKGDDGKEEDVINFMPLKLNEFLEERGRDPKSTCESWLEVKAVNGSKGREKLDGTFGKSDYRARAWRHGKTVPVIQLKVANVQELLGYVDAQPKIDYEW